MTHHFEMVRCGEGLSTLVQNMQILGHLFEPLYLIPPGYLSTVQIRLYYVGHKLLHITFAPTNLTESLRSSQTHTHL
jgi:hypothetical protein